jgi:hypothetical protein
MKQLITCILYIIVCSAMVAGYSGYTPANITINMTNNNTQIMIYNDVIGNIVLPINSSNYSTIYTWNVPFQYNLSDNVTIISYTINQTSSCDLSRIDEINNRINQGVNCTNQIQGEKYYDLYLDCFTNMTICNEYRKNNDQFKLQLDSCSNERNTLSNSYGQLQAQHTICQSNLTSTCNERDQLANEKWFYALVAALIAFGAGYFIFKGLPNMRKTPKFGLDKELSPTNDLSHPYQVKQRVESIFHKKDDNEMVDPTNVKMKGA